MIIYVWFEDYHGTGLVEDEEVEEIVRDEVPPDGVGIKVVSGCGGGVVVL